ncbi:MAG: hypothetical protein HY425_02695 [Candidatus Levybacteria bacterium]|nr:hypothetical protein [Candidatus Levybacteria bacterium]
MRYVLYILLALSALLNLSNTLGGANNGLAIIQLLCVLVGAIAFLLSIYGYIKKTSWRKNVIYSGLGLTFFAGLISLLGAPVWIVQLGSPILIAVILPVVE